LIDAQAVVPSPNVFLPGLEIHHNLSDSVAQMVFGDEAPTHRIAGLCKLAHITGASVWSRVRSGP